MNLKPLLKKYCDWLIFLLVSAILAYANFGLHVELGDFELHHHESGHRETVRLPLSRLSLTEGGTYDLHGTITFGPTASRSLHITPDDVIHGIVINGAEVDLSGIPEESLSDWVNGFTLDAGPYANTGENTISIHFSDYGGDLGMIINPRIGGWQINALSLFWLALGLIWFTLRHSGAKISRLHAALYCLIILGAALRVWTIYTYNPVDHVFSDAQRHWEQGTDVLRNDLMSNTDPIMYQLYVGALAKLSLNFPALIAFYTSILALFTPWVWYRFLRELQGSKTLALTGWAAFSLLPSWIAIYSYFMQETLFLPLLGAALWATWRARRKGTVSSFAWMIVLWIVAGLTRGIAIPLAAVSCTALWLTQGEKLRKALISSCILLFVLGPLTYRSYQAVHHFAPHGMGHLVSIYGMSGKKEIILHIKKGWRAGYGFGSPSMDAPIFEPLSDWTSRRTGQVHVHVDLDKGWEDWNREIERAKESWRQNAWWITGENLAFLMFGPSWPDNNPERLVDSINIHSRWLWAPALLAALVWIFIMRKRLRHQWLLPSLILTWFIVQGLLPITVNEGRYRKPFEGMIIAQLALLAAASRARARAGQPYEWGVDFERWLPRKKTAARQEPLFPAAGEPAPESAPVETVLTAEAGASDSLELKA